ncbi:MAG: carbonic anhydrase family protein [Pseudomonadota bacterium]
MKDTGVRALLALACAVPAVAFGAGAASAPATAASGNDTIERLYQRLSDKLGSVRQPTDDGTMLLRVPSRPEAPAKASPQRKTAAKRPTAAEPAPHGHWSYEGATGPEAWGRLKPEYAKCGSGERQSPIDLRNGFKVQLEPIGFDYRPSAFRVIDNGHTVQVNLAPDNHLSVLGRRYELKQFHFHRPSEMQIAGRAFEMEAHLVHRDDEGRLAVVSVLFERGAGNPTVQQVWNNLPLEKGEEQAARVSLDPMALLPEDKRYYTFMGSLTTPPCSEGVLWMVMKQPVQLTPAQIELFARLYPMNARPVQPAAGRMVKESE